MLQALNILENFDLKGMGYNSTRYIHTIYQAMSLAFADRDFYYGDPYFSPDEPIQGLLSKDYAKERRKLISTSSSNRQIKHGHPDNDSGTVYFCVVDGQGNGCSFINSNYMGFGTGIVPKGCGFSLQNRGYNFSLTPTHPNVVAPSKRPYHTIIPGMMCKNGELVGPFGVMGGFMQPQGHLQVVSNLVDWNMNPQQAIDAPRFCISDGTADGRVSFESGFKEQVLTELSQMGHSCEQKTIPQYIGLPHMFGTGQVITRSQQGVLCAGSDGRNDGQAVGY